MWTLKSEWDTIERAVSNTFSFPHWGDPGTLNALVRLCLGNRAQVEQKLSSPLKRKPVKISKCCGFSQSSGILADVSLCGGLLKFVCTFFCFILCVLFKYSDYRLGCLPVCEILIRYLVPWAPVPHSEIKCTGPWRHRSTVGHRHWCLWIPWVLLIMTSNKYM